MIVHSPWHHARGDVRFRVFNYSTGEGGVGMVFSKRILACAERIKNSDAKRKDK
jgi:hypothetical protein